MNIYIPHFTEPTTWKVECSEKDNFDEKGKLQRVISRVILLDELALWICGSVWGKFYWWGLLSLLKRGDENRGL